MSSVERVFEIVLALYPADYRARFGEEICTTVAGLAAGRQPRVPRGGRAGRSAGEVRKPSPHACLVQTILPRHATVASAGDVVQAVMHA